VECAGFLDLLAVLQTKSSRLSRRRRPCSSAIVSQSTPIRASSTSQDATAVVIKEYMV
jgi:hypothetical protein